MSPASTEQGVLQAVPFEPCGPLPTGTTVLEASAGTGKTYTIATLAARYVAEGHATLPELMLVTFGREATRELRERVRERLGEVARGLDAAAPDDPVVAHLAAAAPDEVARRRRRLAHALAHFDAATIATTHQFCQRMLDGLGMVGDTDPGATFTEDVDDLVTEVVDDFYVRKYAAPGAGEPTMTRDEALAIGRRAVGDPGARLEPADAARDTVHGTRRAFAEAVRAELDHRKRTGRLFTYDDMLTRLRDVLRADGLGATAAARLRSRYRVVLVDEFQDTDPIQWEILRRAFHDRTEPGAALTFIGDPKQAIYAFRGADVVSYLQAVAAAGTRATLTTNWRSDADLVAALDDLLGGAALGHPEIVVGPVEAHHAERRLTGAGAPLRLRVAARDGLPATPAGKPRVPGVRDRVARDLAADVVGLLTGPGRWCDAPVRPGDVAVLVRTNAQGALVHDALTAAGVPAVQAGTQSVFATPSAAEWLTLLEAIEQPARSGRVRAAALTGFLGRRAADLDGGPGDDLLDELGVLLRRWSAVLRDRGVAALTELVVRRQGMPARVLGVTDGERRLTDVRHVGQALHAAAAEGHLGPAALVEWLRRRIAEAGRETRPERSRRLESDTDAVQILTVHRCKGLEFPVVYVPFGWDRNVRDPDLALHHDDDGRRVLAVGGETDPGWKEHVAAHHREEAGEDLRLLYVALTRAQGQVVAWWAPSTTTAAAPLHRLLFARPAPGGEPPARAALPSDAAAWEHLRSLASPRFAVERADGAGDATFRRRGDATPTLAVARFDRTIDVAWRRTSYSALTAAVDHAHPVASEPESAVLDDESVPEERPAPAPPPPDAGLDRPSPLADLPLGTGFGLLVHTVLETADLAAPDLGAELTRVADTSLVQRPAAGVDAAGLATALTPVVSTPLVGGWRLRDVAVTDRLSELDFELPLAGGDTPGATVGLGDVAALLRRHLGPDDPLRAYPDALDPLADQPLRGYLTGSVDAVLRDPDGRYLVVDYKTNWLGPVGPAGREPLTLGHYRPAALTRAMIDAHYPLQALLYSVALHRFLRWRLRGYAPERHLGGVLYLFLRGMGGADTPVVDGGRCGVFAWTPPTGLVAELSGVLDGGGGSVGVASVGVAS